MKNLTENETLIVERALVNLAHKIQYSEKNVNLSEREMDLKLGGIISVLEKCRGESDNEYPNGLNSYLKTYYEISQSMGYYLAKSNSTVLEGLNDDEKIGLVENLSFEFESKINNGIDFYDKMSTFILRKLKPF